MKDIKRFMQRVDYSNQMISLFLRFSQLANDNFRTHHNLKFYADKLALTNIYLSRVVKKISGQTVKYHIDRLIAMEASYLLQNTDHPISRIGEMLLFANSGSFSRFFIRWQGVSPKEYRLYKSHPHQHHLKKIYSLQNDCGH